MLACRHRLRPGRSSRCGESPPGVQPSPHPPAGANRPAGELRSEKGPGAHTAALLHADRAECHDKVIRSEGRTRLDIGMIFAAQNRRKEAMRELARSYQLLLKVGDRNRANRRA